MFISETKLTTKIQDSVSAKIDKNYKSIWNTNKTSNWHGTSIIYKKDTLSLVLESVSKKYRIDSTSKRINETSEEDIDKDTEGRFILCE